MSQRDTVIHLIAGGLGGTAGAIATCPLEVVKTRLQSSCSNFSVKPVCFSPIISNGSMGTVKCKCAKTVTQRKHRFSTCCFSRAAHLLTGGPQGGMGGGHGHPTAPFSMGLYHCVRHIIKQEGPRALFKGLGPNLVGVAPSRAIYFCAYSQAKKFLNCHLNPDTPVVHIYSAAIAGFTASTATNPIWFLKTRLQLDSEVEGRKMTIRKCVRDIYHQGGVLAFYKGITASYFGISETVIHFVIYEAIKQRLYEMRSHDMYDTKTSRDFLEFMCAGAVSKAIASCLAYPHEVARTRLREEGDKYKRFWQTLTLVFQEEGYRGVYRGLGTQLLRQIPNTAIMMSTYEAVVYLLSHWGERRETEFYIEDASDMIESTLAMVDEKMHENFISQDHRHAKI